MVLVFTILTHHALFASVFEHAIFHFTRRAVQIGREAVNFYAQLTIAFFAADMTVRVIVRVAHAHLVDVRWETLRFTSAQGRLRCLLMETLNRDLIFIRVDLRRTLSLLFPQI